MGTRKPTGCPRVSLKYFVLFNKKKDNICDVLNSVLSYIELRKDIAFTLNSEIQ